MNEEILAKARAAESPEELLKLAHENGMSEFTEESAKAYFDTLHRSGELSDEEIDVSAGGCKTKDGKKIVTRGNICPDWHLGWTCKKCHKFRCTCGRSMFNDVADAFGVTGNFNSLYVCGSCANCDYVGGKWICTNEMINLKY